MTNPFDSDEWAQMAADATNKLLPKMRQSGICMAIVTDDPDPKFALELGYMIALDKPIILIVPPGRRVQDKLVRVADRIVEMDESDPEGTQSRLQVAMDEVAKEVGL